MKQRIFIGVYPCGIVYADTAREVAGDYKRLGFLDYATLTLNLEKDCLHDLAKEIRADAGAIQAKRGQPFKLSTCGHSITLGNGADNIEREAYAIGNAAFRAGKKSVPAHDADLMKLIDKHKIGQKHGWTIPVMAAWSRAWHTANARQPLIS